MTPSEQTQAAQLYAKFRTEVPNQSNPTDLNTQAKWDWMVAQGYEAYQLMQRARKQSLAFTKWPKTSQGRMF